MARSDASGSGSFAVSGELVCSFQNGNAETAMIRGADGGESVVVGHRTYWLFGDTLLLPQSGREIQPNAIGWSALDQPGSCPHVSYFSQDGAAAPFIEKDGALTVWAAGAIPVDDYAFDVYTAYVYGSGPYAYWIGEVGVAQVDAKTMGTRILARRLWDASSGLEDQIIGAGAVDIDATGYLRVVLQTRQGDHLLARVPRAAMAESTAYEYWTGHDWSGERGAAAPMWRHPKPDDLVSRLASFDDGTSVAYNTYLNKYVAVLNVGFDQIGARTADRLEGPWSSPTVLLDCSAYSLPAVPMCYSPFQHPQLASDGGRTITITFTRMGTYDTVMYQATLTRR